MSGQQQAGDVYVETGVEKKGEEGRLPNTRSGRGRKTSRSEDAPAKEREF